MLFKSYLRKTFGYEMQFKYQSFLLEFKNDISYPLFTPHVEVRHSTHVITLKLEDPLNEIKVFKLWLIHCY